MNLTDIIFLKNSKDITMIIHYYCEFSWPHQSCTEKPDIMTATLQIRHHGCVKQYNSRPPFMNDDQ